MITSIRLVNFKNFADETLRVGPFTVVVGANASGKSNIRDAFRFLHGVARGYTLAEIMGGKREAGWQPMRGAMNEIIRFGQSTFSLEVELDLPGPKFDDEKLVYSIEIGHHEETGAFQIREERLRDESAVIFTRCPLRGEPADAASVKWSPDAKGNHNSVVQLADRPALTEIVSAGKAREKEQLPGYEKIVILRDVLDRMRFLDPSPQRMREPAFPGATILGNSGENLPTVLEYICSMPGRHEILASWMQELTPMDVEGFEFPRDPSGRVHLVLCEANGRKVSAYSASDGTLRFLAMLAALLRDGGDHGLYFLEEIETGIHPVRLGLLLDLFEGPVRGYGQVIGTTHAPTLLTVMKDDTFANTSVVCRLEDTASAIIRPLAELPNARELRQDQGLGRLHESGWMENALFFTEDYDEAEDGL